MAENAPEAKTEAPVSPEQKRANILRFGLMTIPPVAWAVSFSIPFMMANGAGQDWVSLALIPSLVTAVVVGVICVIVWFAYTRYVLRMS